MHVRSGRGKSPLLKCPWWPIKAISRRLSQHKRRCRADRCLACLLTGQTSSALPSTLPMLDRETFGNERRTVLSGGGATGVGLAGASIPPAGAHADAKSLPFRMRRREGEAEDAAGSRAAWTVEAMFKSFECLLSTQVRYLSKRAEERDREYCGPSLPRLYLIGQVQERGGVKS